MAEYEDAVIDRKTCQQCQADKPLEEFRPLLHFGYHGRDTVCRSCRRKT